MFLRKEFYLKLLVWIGAFSGFGYAVYVNASILVPVIQWNKVHDVFYDAGDTSKIAQGDAIYGAIVAVDSDNNRYFAGTTYDTANGIRPVVFKYAPDGKRNHIY